MDAGFYVLLVKDTFVYSPLDRRDKLEWWQKLLSLYPSSNVPWVILRDFNDLLYNANKCGGRAFDANELRNFCNFMNTLDMVEVDLKGGQFTRVRILMMTSGSSRPTYQTFNHIIDISKIPEDLNTSECNIYRVPCSLRNMNKEAYTPQLISIGPLHLGDQNLDPMQYQKLRYFRYFKDRVRNEEAMKAYKKYLEDEEQAIRRCYADNFPISFTKEKFVEIILLDSVFIMELFLMMNKPELHQDDIILKQTWLNKNIQRDLLLLENQIPLFILEELYSSVVPKTDKKREKFLEVGHDYFECIHPYKKFDDEKQDLDHPEHPENNNNLDPDLQKKPSTRFERVKMYWKNDPVHFTDLIRFILLLSLKPLYLYLCKEVTGHQEVSSSRVLRIATKLQESGVSFEKVTNRSLVDIKLEKVKILSWFLCLGCLPKSSYFKARLQIPQLKIDNTIECVLRNLIAFEQCHYSDQPYICNYVSLIDSLIHTKDDVELLVEKEVIVHKLGSHKEVATLVNSLCKHVVANKTCYKKIIEDLNKHYQNEWYRTMASLRLVYFRDAWRASSTLVGIAVIVFTIFNFCRVVRLVLDLDQRRQPHN
ncbi:UPF0481 protein At3g47200-like [Prosopis cineraria]|uniref:UPF0481 protein At3g47200-like n=1 Tax=Prosopis cineraria TaxID=364024 RepID=UPI00240FAE00|nr:UPF0481 protein At3g47200-like [Prosopis cineraria]